MSDRTKLRERGIGGVRAVLAAGLMLAVGTGLLVTGCGKRGPGGGHGGGGGFAMPPTPVEASEALSGAVADRFETIGSFDAGEAIIVVAEIDGKVIDLPFREGQAIAKGA